MFGLTEDDATGFGLEGEVDFSNMLIDRPTLQPSKTRLAYRTLVPFAYFIASIGLPVSTLLSLDAPQCWTLNLEPMILAGSWTSLAFFIVYVPSLFAFHSLTRQKGAFRDTQSRARVLYLKATRLLAVAMPVAVLIVWMQ